MFIHYTLKLFLVLVFTGLATAQIPTLAILDINSASVEKKHLQEIEDRLTFLIYNSGYYKIIDRANLAKVIDEINFRESDLVSHDEKFSEAKKIYGIDKFLITSVEHHKKNWHISLQILDLVTTEIENLCIYTYKGKIKGFVKEGVSKAYQELFESSESLSPFSVHFSMLCHRNSKPLTLDKNDTLFTGDHCQIQLYPNARAFVYLFNFDAEGKVYTLFPNKTQKYQALQAHSKYYFPSIGQSFKLEGKEGDESIVLIGSKKPLDNLEEILSLAKNSTDPSKSNSIFSSTRGFTSIVDGEKTIEKLQNGVQLEGNSKEIKSSGFMYYEFPFIHGKPQATTTKDK